MPPICEDYFGGYGGDGTSDSSGRYILPPMPKVKKPKDSEELIVLKEILKEIKGIRKDLKLSEIEDKLRR